MDIKFLLNQKKYIDVCKLSINDAIKESGAI